jgi:Mrp family chromosome partitioning ATPase/capsular polysaccharide biosynthesis protein
MATAPEPRQADLRAVLGVLRRRALLILVTTSVVVAAAVGLSLLQEERYDSTVTLRFRPAALDAQLSGLIVDLPGDADRDQETNVGLLNLPVVRERAAARLGPPYTADDLESRVTIGTEGTSNLATITGSATTAREATRIANTMGSEFVAYRRDAVRQQVRRAIRALERRIEALEEDANSADEENRRELRTQQRNLDKLQVLDTVRSGDAEIAQPAVEPDSPAAPKPVTNAILGLILGLVLGLAFALAAEQLDRRYRRPEDLARDLGLQLLATVPQSSVLKADDGWRLGLDGAEAEAFRRLRTTLRHQGGGSVHSVLVTSASPTSGKTTVSLHLALAAAGVGDDVLLVETDLRRPRLAEVLELPAEEGISTWLGADEPAPVPPGGRFLLKTDRADDPDGEDHPRQLDGSVEVLLGGAPPPNPSEMLDSAPVRRMIEESQAHYDFVVLDAPPAGIVADPIPLAKQVDGVIIVARLGKESRDGLEALRDDLQDLGIPIIGVVATFGPRVESSYYSSYTASAR